MERRSCETPLEDLRKDALSHYEIAPTEIGNWYNQVPRAINFFYDYQQMSFWQKLKQAFKK